MIIGKYQFKPTLIPFIVTVLLLVLFVKLGFWQIGRADYKLKLIADRDNNTKLPLMLLNGSTLDKRKLLSRKVEIKGAFLADRQASLININYKSRLGYFIITPFKIDNSKKHILVVQGWVPWDQKKAPFHDLPEIPEAHKGPLKISGIIDTLPAVGRKLGEPDQGFNAWPKMIIYVDLKWYEKKLGIELLPYVVKQISPENKDKTLVRDWNVLINKYEGMSPEKHQGYVFQWFAMALVLLGVFLGVNLKRAGTSPGEKS